MRAIVRSIDANDVPDWPHWQAKGVESERQWFTVAIGTEGIVGSDLFQVCVASVAWLRRFPSGRFAGLVSPQFDADSVRSTLESFVASASGDDWPRIVSTLSTRMRWEFAGMA